MGKKSKRNRSKQQSSSGGVQAAAAAADQRRQAPALRKTGTEKAVAGDETKDDLQFEDPFPEEYEDEEFVEEDDDEEWDDAEGNEDGGGDVEVIQSWHPLAGDAKLEPGEKLEMDPAAYKMHHAMTADWPSLSFDFVRDDLGESRTRFPHALIAAVGTQADRPDRNQLTIMKLSDLSRIEAETDDDILGEEYDSSKKDGGGEEDDDDDSSSDDEVDLDPIMEHYSMDHRGGVNRVRVMPQQPHVVATWSDAGTVNLYNVESILERFSVSEGKAASSSSDPKKVAGAPSKPFFTYSKHGTEGYAMDWSPVKEGVLATGDCNGGIHVWTPRLEGGYSVVPTYDCSSLDRSSVEGSASVEDVQWSPTEATVFASAECGGYVRIFDTRAPNRAMISHKIHSNGADVNVLSWNKLVANLLATGSDDGVLSVWDLRNFSSSPSDLKPLARFTPHKTPLTSVEWHPTDESMLAVSDDNGAYVYDLSVEEEDQNAAAAAAGGEGGMNDVPPQLLFVHCGSEQFKEVHWHPQIPSLLMTTALSGYSVFIPSNL